MLIKLGDINKISSDLIFFLPRNVFTNLEDRFSFKGLNCRANLIRKEDIVTLKGEYNVVIHTHCDLCLVSMNLDMNSCFDLIIAPEKNEKNIQEDCSISLNMLDVEYYKGQEFFIDHYFEKQLILDFPMSFNCSEECRGLCFNCGTNLNNKACQCPASSNSPFYVLNQLKIT